MNLSKFCPTKQFQYESTCYSFAVTYTALSTTYNIINNITDRKTIEKNYFSSGVVASRHNANLRLSKRSPKCGKYGTSEKALKILKDTGTVFSKDYDCNCKRFKKVKRKVGKDVFWYKIANYKTLKNKNKYSVESVDWIKAALDNKRPVVTSIYNSGPFKKVKTNSLDMYTLGETTKEKLKNNQEKGVANHVVCILGYDDNFKNDQGYFLVKNNYKTWGDKKGFSWVPYVYFLPLIKKAHYITEIILPKE